MDAHYEAPETYYESIVLKDDNYHLINHVKHQAYRFMDSLEGWCSKNKAGMLIDLIFMCRPQKIVEIGVYGGKSLIPMAYALKTTGSGKIYGVDPWNTEASIDGMEGINYDWWGRVDHNSVLQGLLNKIHEFQLENYIELIQTTSELAPEIPFIDMIHIDGNHSEKASLIDVNKWIPLLKKGGIIIFDDLDWGTNAKAVEWLDENCIRISEFHDGNIWAIWVKP